MKSSKCRLFVILFSLSITISPSVVFAQAQLASIPPKSLGQKEAISANPAIAGATDVASTFDPNGPYDHDELIKDPVGGAPPPPEESSPDETGDPRGGTPPTNDGCSSATVIPGNIVTYNPALLFTGGATSGLCDALESCESGNVGVSNSVWYSYTPNLSGTVTINTFGSNYNTVLSVFTGSCGFFAPPGNCNNLPTQLACNDDYPFGNTSQVTLAVQAGVNYKIKVADYNTTDGGGSLDFNLTWSPANDFCADAIEIPGIQYDPPTYSTVNASTEICENQETCELNNVGVSNTVWYSYTAACDGAISINTNGSTYDTVLSVFDRCGFFYAVDFPCNYGEPAPVEIACDDDAGTGLSSQLLGVPVVAGQSYLIKVSDYNTSNGGGFLDFNFMFTGADAPTATITSPASLSCICGNVAIDGTAAAGAGPVTWSLESQQVGASNWASIASGNSAINNGTLGTLNTAGLSQGYHVLRLSVRNSCGMSNTAITMFFVDQQFDSFDWRAPNTGNLVAGTACIDGTVWDHCFGSYTVMYRPAGTASFTPVDPNTPVYSTAVINDPLAGGGWDTTGLPDGDYELRVQATDQCGHTNAEIRTITVDNTSPTAHIMSPVSCTAIPDTVVVMGTAVDAHLGSWTLQYTGGNAHDWVTISSGTSPVFGGTVGTWNTTGLPACDYTIRLLVTDATVVNCGPNRHQSEYTVSVNLGVTSATCCDVNHDGLSDGLDVAPFVQCLINGSCP